MALRAWITIAAGRRRANHYLIPLHDDGAVDLLDQVELDDDRRALLLRVLRLLFVVGQVPGFVALGTAGDDPRLAVEADAAGAIRILLARGIAVIDHDIRIFAEPLLRRAVAALPVAQRVVVEDRNAALRADLRMAVLRCRADQAGRAVRQRLVQQVLHHRRDLDHDIVHLARMSRTRQRRHATISETRKRLPPRSRKADRMIPGDRLLEVKHREAGEHQEGDDLLHGLELRRRIDRVAPAVGRHRQAIFDQRDAPGRENHADERHLLEAQMAVPGERHEDVGAEQHQDRQHIGRGQHRGHGNLFGAKRVRQSAP